MALSGQGGGGSGGPTTGTGAGAAALLLAVTGALGRLPEGLDGGAAALAAVPCTGFWSAAPTSRPMIQASTTTAATDRATASTRLRQYTFGGNGPAGSIMKRT
jgi:hypothetical protein